MYILLLQLSLWLRYIDQIQIFVKLFINDSFLTSFIFIDEGISTNNCFSKKEKRLNDYSVLVKTL